LEDELLQQRPVGSLIGFGPADRQTLGLNVCPPVLLVHGTPRWPALRDTSAPSCIRFQFFPTISRIAHGRDMVSARSTEEKPLSVQTESERGTRHEWPELGAGGL